MSAQTKLPSTFRFKLPLKKQYNVPLIRTKPQPKLIVRKTPYLKGRVKSSIMPTRYTKSIVSQYQKIDDNLRKSKNINLEKAREIKEKAHAVQMKAKGMFGTLEYAEQQRAEKLNFFKYNSKTYKRYMMHLRSVKSLSEIQELRMANFEFFLAEAKIEITKPNNDYMTDQYLLQVRDNPKTSDEELEYVTSKIAEKTMGLAPPDKNVAFTALLDILQKLQEVDQLLKIRTSQFTELFELTLHMTTQMELRNNLITFTGRMLHRLTGLKHMRKDRIASLITSLIQTQQFGDAMSLLKEFDNENAIWYKLKVLTWSAVGNLYEAENVANEIKKKFKVRFVHGDLYMAIIQRYVFGQNYERSEIWRKEFESMIEQRGFARNDKQISKFHEAPDEKSKLEYMGQFGPIGKMAYLTVLGWYIATPQLNDKVPQMIQFYVDQPGTKVKDLEDVLVAFKYEMSSKIKPQLQHLKNRQAEKHLMKFVDDYQQQNPVISEQEEFLNSFLKELAEIGGFKSIVYVIEKLIAQKQKPSGQHFNSLLEALLRRDQVDHAYKVLDALENSFLILEEELKEPHEAIERPLIPPVNSHHYATFLKYYSRKPKGNKYFEIIERFKNVRHVFDPVILSQILKTLAMQNKMAEAFQYIDEILLEGIHTQTQPKAVELHDLYLSIWTLIKKRSISNDPVIKEKIDLPDMRFVFMRMIHDKVVPSAQLYHIIIQNLLHVCDYYGVICVLQYMGKIHRTRPHMYTRVELRRLAKYIKYNPESLKNLPLMDPRKRYEVDDWHDKKYWDAFVKLRAEDSGSSMKNGNSMDPFAPNNDTVGKVNAPPMEGDDETDIAWKFLVTQMMRITTAQLAYNREDLVQVHNDFGLTYEADKIVKDHDDWVKVERKSKWEVFVENTKTLREMDPLPDFVYEEEKATKE